MNSKAVRRLLRVIIPLAILFWLVPWIAGIFIVCGLIDFARHKRFDSALIAKYFSGNGLLTWVLSPVNLLFDLISKRHHYRMQLSEFPDEERAEIEEMLQVFKDRQDEILTDLKARMGDKRRGMVFYRWYDEQGDQSIPEFNRDFKYIKTIGVSLFNGQEKTSLHFGPLRLTIRLLYNMTTRQSDEVFIEVNGEKHFWHDDPLFIFRRHDPAPLGQWRRRPARLRVRGCPAPERVHRPSKCLREDLQRASFGHQPDLLQELGHAEQETGRRGTRCWRVRFLRSKLVKGRAGFLNRCGLSCLRERQLNRPCCAFRMKFSRLIECVGTGAKKPALWVKQTLRC
jgi:aspartyl/asparaginyl beta-hydroxylase (cupin superfamily)